MSPKYPEITVKLTGEDGNSAHMIGRTCQALRRGYVPNSQIEAFAQEATSSDYDNVLVTIMDWVNVE